MAAYYDRNDVVIHCGDALEVLRGLPDGSVHCSVTSPPYWGLRDYGVSGQIGLEATPEEYVARLVEVFREVRRVLRDDGTCWINLGDSYAAGGKGGGGSFMAERREPAWQKQSKLNGWRSHPPGLKDKDLVGIPWMVAFALRSDGWYLRSDIIWHKRNPMPESVTDRPTKAHEYLFLLSKSERYHYDAEAIKEPAIGFTTHDLTGAGYSAPGQTSQNGNRKGNAKTFRGGGAYTQGRSFDNDGMVDRDSHGNAPNEQGTRNKRSVWTVATQPNSLETYRRVRVQVNEPCDGSERIASPDCPLHGDRSVPVASVLCDEHEGDLLSRNGHTSSHHDQEQLGGCAPIARPREDCSAADSSDSPRRSCSDAATGRSTQMSKTDLDPATKSPCTPFAQTVPDTESSEAGHAISGSAERTPANSIGADSSQGVLGLDPSGQIQNRNAGTCTCKHYIMKTEKLAHFATFPEALIEPCIKAGCPRDGTALDPFGGSGTTAVVARKFFRRAVLIELNEAYCEMAVRRVEKEILPLEEVWA